MAPGARVPALLEGRDPGFIARLARTRNDLPAPQLFAVSRIVAADIAAAETVGRAARHDHAVGNDRTRRVGDIAIAAARVCPRASAGFRIEPDDDVVEGDEDHVVAIDSNRAVR